MKKLTQQGYFLLREKLNARAMHLSCLHERMEATFVSLSQYPCVYQAFPGRPNSTDFVVCLTTGARIDKKPLPVGNWFNTDEKQTILHYSAKGCPHLTTEDSVLCLNVEKRQVAAHKVGGCSHKQPFLPWLGSWEEQT